MTELNPMLSTTIKYKLTAYYNYRQKLAEWTKNKNMIQLQAMKDAFFFGCACGMWKFRARDQIQTTAATMPDPLAH